MRRSSALLWRNGTRISANSVIDRTHFETDREFQTFRYFSPIPWLAFLCVPLRPLRLCSEVFLISTCAPATTRATLPVTPGWRRTRPIRCITTGCGSTKTSASAAAAANPCARSTPLPSRRSRYRPDRRQIARNPPPNWLGWLPKSRFLRLYSA